eukprot:4049545-Prymnesium_polylepis.2
MINVTSSRRTSVNVRGAAWSACGRCARRAVTSLSKTHVTAVVVTRVPRESWHVRRGSWALDRERQFRGTMPRRVTVSGGVLTPVRPAGVRL